MPFLPPLIKPPPPPLRPPVSPPYRPPGTNRLPPTQTVPIYQPPDLLPTTGLDLKGVVCIYSNAPFWEPKKIRYRYLGESWQEIAGNSFTLETIPSTGGDTFDSWILWRFEAKHEVWANTSTKLIEVDTRSGKFYFPSQDYVINGKILQIVSENFFRGAFSGANFNGFDTVPYIVYWINSSGQTNRSELYPRSVSNPHGSSNELKKGSSPPSYVEWRLASNVNVPLPSKCRFKVFNVLNQVILDITKNVCPDVIVVPERCYFKAENEKLVARVIQTLLDPPLRVEYQGHCATVWKDGIINLPPYPLQIYKECSDNNCPPPRIRFDQKCEEKCEQCPSGTAVKVLLGNRIACVDAFGCVKKMLKYKPGCNNYACICG